MILEKLGIPDNIIESAHKIWSKTIDKINKSYNLLTDDGHLIYHVSKLKVGDYDIKAVHIKFNINYHESIDKPTLAGMSIVNSINPNEDDDIHLIKYKSPSELRFIVNVYLNENNDKKDLINFLIDSKIQIISSFSHELKHAYDFKMKSDHHISSEMDYVDMNKLGTGSPTFDHFLYYVYVSHLFEVLVKPTEVGAEIKMSDIKKSEFKDFLSSNRAYNDFKSMSEYSYKEFYNGLKSEMDYIVDFLSSVGVEMGTEEENINKFLKLLFNHLMNSKAEILNRHISRINPLLLVFNSNKVDKLFNDLRKLAIKYENKPKDFFENQIKYINFVGKKNIKKLVKLYDIIEDEPNNIHHNINKRVSNFKNFNNG